MQTYVILLRGINVGGNNKVPMADLKQCLETIGFINVVTYIASGNVIVDSNKNPDDIRSTIETMMPQHFTLDSDVIKIHVLTRDQLKAIIDNKPKGFGEQPDKYHSDAIFLMGITSDKAMEVFSPREGVDRVWAGNGVIYSQRLSSERTKSRLGKIVGTTPYKSMTIRNWNTTTKLLALVNSRDNKQAS